MRNKLLGLICLLLSLNAYAQGNENNQGSSFKSGSLKTTFNKEVIEYRFKSLEDLNEQIEGIIGELVYSSEKKEVCELMVELKLQFIIGTSTMIISETITTGCGDETRLIAVRKFKALIYAAIG